MLVDFLRLSCIVSESALGARMAEATAPKSKGMERVKGLDLYQLLEVEVAADAKTIKKAYRKKALTCHPDKNPDDKKAVELFHQLSGKWW